MKENPLNLLILPHLAICTLLSSLAMAEHPLDRLNVYNVPGYESGSRIYLGEWQDLRLKTFEGQKVIFFNNKENPPTRAQLLKIVQNADIFFYSGHSGVPKVLPDSHVLLTKPSTASDNGFVTSAQIRGALKGLGPRLVIINGCKTTDLNDGVKGGNRMSAGFGITPATQGRAYLGWPSLVWGIKADDRIGQFLNAWTKKKENGFYPTLEEAKNSVGIQNLNIIGDKQLRYRERYRLVNEKIFTKGGLEGWMYWRPTGATGGTAELHFRAPNPEQLSMLNVPEKIEFQLSKTDNGFVLEAGKFKQLLQGIADAVAKGFGAKEANVSMTIERADILVEKGKDEKLKVTMETTVVTAVPNMKESTNSETNVIDAVPSREGD